MPTLRDIKRRIRSVENTEQITRAMKMIAGARLRRSQERMLAMRPYVRELARIIWGLLPDLAGDEHTLLERRPEVRRAGLVLVTPDRGLCGGLPGNLAREAARFVGERASAGVEVVAFAAGRKGRRALSASGAVELALVADGDSEQPQAAAAERIADSLADAFEEERIDEGHIVYAEFRSAAVQRVRCVPIVPIDREGIRHDAPLSVERDDRPYAGAELEPDVAAVVQGLLRRYLSAAVYKTLLEGAASELGARLTAMDAATRNANELIGELTLQYNKARQANITKELMDIVGGVEALR